MNPPAVLPDFTAWEWALAALAALGIGVSKSGLPGVSLLHVVLFAHLFPGLRSTGIVLPMLIVGDLGAVLLFRRHAQWSYVLKTLPPAVVGVAIGWLTMRSWPALPWNPIIGAIVLLLALLQLLRNSQPQLLAQVPHSHAFAWLMGLTAGITTMVANAAGPVMALYLLAVALPKAAFVGTAAWFFLLINLLKVPFSFQLGFILPQTLLFNLLLIPLIIAGLFAGRSLVAHIPQKTFDTLILLFAIAASIKLIAF
jgi:uncharacterized membrane protein YfcA